jgi:hypothetical protein
VTSDLRPSRWRSCGPGPGGTLDRHVIRSFVYPFRGPWRGRRWLLGVCLVALFPMTFPAVLGYAVACVRSAACDPTAPPPRWGLHLRDGSWAALQAAALTAPFVLLAWLLLEPLFARFLWTPLAWIAAVTVAALPWGVAMLVAVPPTLASFAVTRRPSDLARLRLVLSCVRDRYADWNVVLVGITTAWVLAAVGLAALVVGIVPGAFYAILVSAHACSALAPHRTPG